MFGRVPGTRPNISESHSEIRTRVSFCIEVGQSAELAAAGEQLVAGGESEGCCLIRMVGVLASRLVEPLQGGCSHNENAGLAGHTHGHRNVTAI